MPLLDDYPYGMYLVFKYGAIASKDILLPVFRGAAWRYATDKTYRKTRDVGADAAKLASMVDKSFTIIKNGGDLLANLEDLINELVDTIKRLFGSDLFVNEQHIEQLKQVGQVIKYMHQQGMLTKDI